MHLHPTGFRENARPLARRRVLVVEDDRELRGALADLLRLEGWEVDEAENGIEALLALRTGAVPDALLLDLVMPLMNGWELRNALLADPLLAGLPVVVLSGSDAERIDADAFLVKPCPPDRLLATLARLVPGAVGRAARA